MQQQLEEVAARIHREARITVLTGAGVSAPSGVPTFRGADGLWENHPVEELASRPGFDADPERVWRWYDWRRQKIASCEPNAAHHVLAAWSLRYPGFTLVTQNVDGLHELTGTKNVVRLHGSIWEHRCLLGCQDPVPRWRDETVPLPELPVRCPHCGGFARPGVVWFGEAMPTDAMEGARRAVVCDLFFAIGTSAQVYPAAGLLPQAKMGGAMTVEINPEPAAMPGVVDVALAGSADVVLEGLEQLLVG